MKLVGATGIEDRLQVSLRSFRPRDVWGRIVMASFYMGGLPYLALWWLQHPQSKIYKNRKGPRKKKNASVELRDEFLRTF
jgi:hypothetical protein